MGLCLTPFMVTRFLILVPTAKERLGIRHIKKSIFFIFSP
jgi:hypothetical protein